MSVLSATQEILLLDGTQNSVIDLFVEGFGTSVDITPANMTLFCDSEYNSTESDIASIQYVSCLSHIS